MKHCRWREAVEEYLLAYRDSIGDYCSGVVARSTRLCCVVKVRPTHRAQVSHQRRTILSWPARTSTPRETLVRTLERMARGSLRTGSDSEVQPVWQDVDNGACAYLDRAERDLDARRGKTMLGCGGRETKRMLEGRMEEYPSAG